jgi:hypothetical protein
MCGSGARWCARADAMFDVAGLHVLEVAIDELARLVLTVESDRISAACPSCGVIATNHGRRVRVLRRTLLRPGHAGPLAGAGLAVPRTGLCQVDVHRSPRPGATPDGADETGGGVGDQRAQL